MRCCLLFAARCVVGLCVLRVVVVLCRVLRGACCVLSVVIRAVCVLAGVLCVLLCVVCGVRCLLCVACWVLFWV